jgi:hypothetical protein
MALSNMQVFINNATDLSLEKLGQKIALFNGASGGTIRLTGEGFSGDFFQTSFYNSLTSAQRRVDRYATNNAQASTDLTQDKYSDVKVAGGFGPILFEPAQLSWIQSNEIEALDVISTSMAEAILSDQLNTSIASLVGAISNVAGATHDISASAGLTQGALNTSHAKFGDSSQNLIAQVMRGSTYHKLIGQNIANAQNLFTAGDVRVVDILGKPVVVTDAPALREAGTPNKEKVLSLASGAITVGDGSDLITNIETSNGKERIETTMQSDYTFTLSMLGYGWDETNGGKSPTDAELATGSNWDLFVNDIKHSAGVITISDEDQ